MSEATRGATVDREKLPHLHRMQVCVDEMEARVETMQDALPFRLITWHRAKREWKQFQREWKAERKLHRASTPTHEREQS